ncbi:MAG TPA: KamA family radical SAM protein [Candidatus Limiplasma sp.]|nr:KamA family radical SAM protein [Candidatus Limiplasma sp.]
MFYRSVSSLAQKLRLTQAQVDMLAPIAEKYPMQIPAYYLSLIDPDDPDDPIRKMAVPANFEQDKDGSFDTSGEHDNTVLPGLQHKYRQTALILSTSKCAMYCRHCFRKRLVGGEDDKEIAANFGAIVRYIQEHAEITNVLLSGGDSLLIANAMVRRWLEALTRIRHLDFIRFGTRVPVTFPRRITENPELVSILKEFSAKKQISIVTQFNHPREITAQSKKAVKLLRGAGAVVKNQTVLLRGVNDDPQTLGTLLRQLTAMGCMPYYIFQCRPVKGVKGGFQVPLHEGYAIVEAAKAMQNGFGKHLRYCLSHPTGKIELLGKTDSGDMITKYHEAKDVSDYGKIVIRKTDADQCWYN